MTPVRGPGASLRITHPGLGAPLVAGSQSLERREEP